MKKAKKEHNQLQVTMQSLEGKLQRKRDSGVKEFMGRVKLKARMRAFEGEFSRK